MQRCYTKDTHPIAMTDKKPETSQSKARKKTAPTKRAAQTAATKQGAQTASDRKKSGSPQSVVLPSNMSKRSIEKSAVLRDNIDAYLRKSMYYVASVAGLVFVLGGALFAGSELLHGKEGVQLQMLGETISATDGTSTSTEETTFAFASDIPSQINDPYQVYFTSTNADGFESVVVKVGGNQTVGLDVTEHNTVDKYGVLIPGDQLAPGTYVLRVHLRSTIDDTMTAYDSPEFEVVGDTVTGDDTTTTATTTNEETTFFFETDLPRELDDQFRVYFSITNAENVKALVVNASDGNSSNLAVTKRGDGIFSVDIPADELSPATYELRILMQSTIDNTNVVNKSSTFKVVRTDTDPVQNDSTTLQNDTEESKSVNDLIEIDNAEKVDEISSNDNYTFKLLPPDDYVLTGTEVITVDTTLSLPYLELYARPLNALEPRFVTLSGERLGETSLRFVVNSTHLPNGRYEFFARSEQNGKIIETEQVEFRVQNEVSTQSGTERESLITITKPGDDNQERELPTLEDPTTTPSTSLNAVVEEETAALLRQHRADMNELLQRYAVAQQSGDQILINAAAKALDEFRKNLVTQALSDQRTQGIADNLDRELASRIANLQTRVSSFEQIRRDRSSGATAVDSDQDGISDQDERLLYKTDPNVADTDNDGISDGVEIIRGYNPLDSTPEAVIAFESPKESVGLERDDVLRIESVVPVVSVSATSVPTTSEPEASATSTAPVATVDSDDAEKPRLPVKSEIRGVGLPNSFVTLYIYSTPTIVTVRTDADGSFVYTFDKELADGRHDVYVAITDNAGEIVAQSSPFSFIKEAQAYTPVDASQAEVITSAGATESLGNPYNIAGGIGILAFGLILIMLGMSLRTNEDDISLEETVGDNASPKSNEFVSTAHSATPQIPSSKI